MRTARVICGGVVGGVLAFAASAAFTRPTASAQDLDPARRPANAFGERPLRTDGRRDVAITTADGMHLAATWWDKRTAGAPGVVLLHGFGADRTAWDPLVPFLRARGLVVLAVDLRGHGGSALQQGVDLAPLAADPEGSLFQEMHADALAAVRWMVKDGRCDPRRIALVGSDIGGSVALDAAGRSRAEIAAVVDLIPAAQRLRIDCTKLPQAFPETTPLLLVSLASCAADARAVHEALPASRLLVYEASEEPRSLVAPAGAPDTWRQGTGLFFGSAPPLSAQTVASFVALKLGSTTDDVLLDGIVTTSRSDSDPWQRATRVQAKGPGSAWAYRVGERIDFAGVAPEGYAWAVLELDTGPSPQIEVQLPSGVVRIGPWTKWISLKGAGDPPAELWLSGQTPIQGQIRPHFAEVRVVRQASRTTFEGELLVDEYELRNMRAFRAPFRFRVRFERTAPADFDAAPVPDGERFELKSR